MVTSSRAFLFLIILSIKTWFPALPPFVKCGGPRFQTGHVTGGNFSEILVGGTKRGGVEFFVLVQWGELVKAGQFFLNDLQK